jgi:Family of unknown function (DUF6614)
MDIYHVWCDLTPGTSDVELCQRIDGYLGELKAAGSVEAYRITRRKLGLGPADLGEFHILIEFQDLAQLDAAFHQVATRAGAVEGLHQAVNSVVRNFTAALYRDFPDPFRQRGEEKF